MMMSADNFWIELDRLLGAPTTAAQMEALMESYGPVWPDWPAPGLDDTHLS
jgi:hypothetical protein